MYVYSLTCFLLCQSLKLIRVSVWLQRPNFLRRYRKSEFSSFWFDAHPNGSLVTFLIAFIVQNPETLTSFFESVPFFPLPVG